MGSTALLANTADIPNCLCRTVPWRTTSRVLVATNMLMNWKLRAFIKHYKCLPNINTIWEVFWQYIINKLPTLLRNETNSKIYLPRQVVHGSNPKCLPSSTLSTHSFL